MKLPLFLAAALLPLPAAAQSLDQTHERIWFPTGKTPMLYYKPIAQPACTTTSTRHQAGKTVMLPKNQCEQTAKVKGTTQVADQRGPGQESAAE